MTRKSRVRKQLKKINSRRKTDDRTNARIMAEEDRNGYPRNYVLTEDTADWERELLDPLEERLAEEA